MSTNDNSKAEQKAADAKAEKKGGTPPQAGKAGQPVAAYSHTGVFIGSKRFESVARKGGTRVPGGTLAVDELRWHPLGLQVRHAGRTLVIPAAMLDVIEVEEG